MTSTKKTKSKSEKTTKTAIEPSVDASPKMVKKVELVDAVVKRTGLKKRDVKPSVEAALLEIADALSSGLDLNLPPMGKIKVLKTKDLDGGGKALTLKLRLSNRSEPITPEPIAAE